MNFAAIDFETAGDARDSACAVGVCRVEDGRVVFTDAALIRPPTGGAVKFSEIHGLTWADLKGQPPFGEVWPKFAPLIAGCTRLVAHNAPFDRSVMEACCKAAGIPAPALPWVCTLAMARKRWPKPLGNKLPEVCERLGVALDRHHHAGADAEVCARVLLALEAADAGTDGPSQRAGAADGRGRAADPGIPGAAEGAGGQVRVPRLDGLPHPGGEPAGGPLAARVRDLAAPAGQRWLAAADRLIADAAAGGWLPDLLGYVEAWAAGRAVVGAGSDPCRVCGKPTRCRTSSTCVSCVEAEDRGAGSPAPPLVGAKS